MRFRIRHVLLVLAAIAVSYVATVRNQDLAAAYPDAPVQTEGMFPRNGENPGEPLPHGEHIRRWGSYVGSDENTGSWKFGPFPAPHRLRVAVSGFPTTKGIELYVERTETKERIALPFRDVGSTWLMLDLTLPTAWKGKPVVLVAIDATKSFGGWVGITEPIHGGLGGGNGALYQSIACALVNGLVLAVLWLAAARFVLARQWVPAPWAALVAAGAVATSGYLLFWAYFASPTLGKIATVALLVGAIYAARRTRKQRSPRDAAAEVRCAFALTVAIGLFYLAVLHLFPSSREYYDLAANRFREGLPGDNTLPHNAAWTLFTGGNLRPEGAEWLTSDRPPLQSGWQLITLPYTHALHLEDRAATGTSALWLQALWVPAAFALLRTLGVARRRAVAWTILLGLTGFFAQNTVFTWPKLSAAAFGCGAFALWFLVRSGSQAPDSAEPSAAASGGEAISPVPRVAIGAALAGLAWLSHGGIAFSFLALAPFALWRVVRGHLRPWLAAAVVFLLFALPWLAFQKLYDPPGDRLIKMHLGGHDAKDPRGSLAVIREAYHQHSWAEIIEFKRANFRMLVMGDWPALFDFNPEAAGHRRDDEFFFTVRALTWWLAAGAIFPLALLQRRVRQNLARVVRAHALLIGWTALTIVIWCLLMFGGYTTSIHQGSYAILLTLFVVLSAWLEYSGRRWIYAVGGLQLATFVTTWAWSNPHIDGSPAGWPFLAITAGALGLAFFRCTRSIPEDRASAGGEPNWLHSQAAAWLAVVVGAGLLVLHKPWALTNAQLWAEDGSVFLNGAEQHGAKAIFLSYQGYLHLIPRLIVWISDATTDVRQWPLCYNLGALLVAVGVLARIASARLVLRRKLWMILAFAITAQSGEALLNITNVQWIAAFLLVLQLFISPAANTLQLAGDVVLVVLAGLTGPFALLLLPFFAWRTRRERTRANIVILATVAACAAVQLWFLVREPGSATAPRPDHVDLLNFLAVIGNRLVVWPFFGAQAATTLAPIGLAVVGATVLAIAATSAYARRHAEPASGAVLLLCALIVAAVCWRARPDGWQANDIDNGDRYFFIPRVLFVWVVIWQFDARLRWLARAARGLCLVGAVMEAPHHRVAPPPDYHWADHCDPIRRGIPARIPTLPEGWNLNYPGRPRR